MASFVKTKPSRLRFAVLLFSQFLVYCKLNAKRDLQFKEKDKMENRFFESGEKDIDFYREASTSNNTKKSTKNWMVVFSCWAKCRHYEQEIHEIPPNELNNILMRFYTEIRKKDSSEYEPSCLRVMMSSIDRHLREKNYGKSIMRSEEFKTSREVLEGVCRELRRKGKGKLPNRARSMTTEEIAVFWNSGQLGGDNPRSLLQTVWWNNCFHFGLRSREVHHGILMQDFETKFDDNGRKYISFREGLTKTRCGGLNFKPRNVYPPMYATGGARCPVIFFEKYVGRRPDQLKTVGPLYLAVIDNPRGDIWYKTIPMGVHTIDNMVKTMKNSTSLATLSKKLTNHSARKTTVKILRNAKFPKCEIKNLTGHATEKGLDAYDSGDEEELRAMSLSLHPDPAIANAAKSSVSSTLSVAQNSVSSVLSVEPPQQQLSYREALQEQQVKLAQKFNINLANFVPNFNFNTGLKSPLNNCSSGQSNSGGGDAMTKTVYNNCTFVYKKVKESKPKTRKIRVIQSDSESSQEF